jgi:hypothetical protein
MTVLEWDDWESFEKGFYDPQVQADLQENVKKIADYVYVVSEVLAETRNR